MNIPTPKDFKRPEDSTAVKKIVSEVEYKVKNSYFTHSLTTKVRCQTTDFEKAYLRSLFLSGGWKDVKVESFGYTCGGNPHDEYVAIGTTVTLVC